MANSIGLVNQDRLDRFMYKENYIKELSSVLYSKIFNDEINPTLEKIGESKISINTRISKVLSRPNISFKHIESNALKDFLIKEKRLRVHRRN